MRTLKISQQVRLWLASFSVSSFVRNRVPWSVSEWLFPPPSAASRRDFFLWYLLWDPGKIPGGNLTVWRRQPYDGASLEFLTFRLVHMEPLAIQLQSWCSHRLLSGGPGSPNSPYLPTCLSSLGQQLPLCPPQGVSYRSKKSHWFFSLFSFVVVVRVEWQLPSSLLTELEVCIFTIQM